MSTTMKWSGNKLAESFLTVNRRIVPFGYASIALNARKTKKAYLNLASNVYEAHTDEILTLPRDSDAQPLKMESYFFTVAKEAVRLHPWLDLVVMVLQPFRFVEDEVIEKHVITTVSVLILWWNNSIWRWSAWNKKSTHLLPDMLAIIFDGFTSGSTHYLVIFSYLQTAIIKLQDEKTENLTSAEKSNVSIWLKGATDRDAGSNFAEQLSMADRAMKIGVHDPESSFYWDTRFLLTTSSIFERFLSKRKYTSNRYSKNSFLETFEWQVFLFSNDYFWDAANFNSLPRN